MRLSSSCLIARCLVASCLVAICLLSAAGATAQQITVTQPAGGELWGAGTPHYVRWNFEGGEGPTVTVELLKAGVVVQTLSADTPTEQGFYDWTVGAAAGSGYSVRVTSNSHPAYSGNSGGAFTVQSGSLLLGWPYAAAMAAPGFPSKIAWTYTGSPGTVNIDLYKGGVFNSTIAVAAALGSGGAGSYTWTPSTQLPFGADYSVLLTSAADATIRSQSSGAFRIEPGSITVTSPHGGETWIMGWCYDFTWTYAGPVSPTVNVRVIDTVIPALGSGTVSGVPIGADGSGRFHHCFTSQEWDLGAGRNYKFQVSDTANAEIAATSAINFRLSGGTVRVTSPKGGELWSRGTAQTITWAWGGIPEQELRIELLQNHAVVSTISTSAPSGWIEYGDPAKGTGSYSWNIPSTLPPGNNYQVRVSILNGGPTDASDSYFTLQ